VTLLIKKNVVGLDVSGSDKKSGQGSWEGLIRNSGSSHTDEDS
jgi:hypothetical protein